MKAINLKEIGWTTALTILSIACFPANPLVLTGVIEVESYPALFILGWVFWVFGMVLVMAPIVMFPRRGGVPKRKPFVHTTRLVNTGIYAVVRHPQYTGGVYAIFLTTFLWYPHWLFAVPWDGRNTTALISSVMSTEVICKECRKRTLSWALSGY